MSRHRGERDPLLEKQRNWALAGVGLIVASGAVVLLTPDRWYTLATSLLLLLSAYLCLRRFSNYMAD